MTWRAHVGRGAALIMIAGLLIGCSTRVTTSDGRPMPPEPRAAPVTPAGAEANAMALLVGLKPTDTDGNGYPDQIGVQAFLYAQPHPTSIHEAGTFVFELFRVGVSSRRAEPIAVWHIDSDTVNESKIRSRLFSRGYRFKLNLLQCGGDVLPAMTTNLVGRFEPADGRPPIRSSGVRIIQVGRGTTASASAQPR